LQRGGTLLAAAFRLDVLRELVAEAFAVEEHGLDAVSGVAGAAATVGPLIVGVAAGNRLAGLIAAIGGLNTALCVPRAGVGARLFWGELFALIGCVAVVLADVSAPTTWLLVAVSAAWVGATALLRAAGPRGALTGFAVSAVLVILGGISKGGPPLGDRLWWFAAGEGAALVVMALARHASPATRAAPARTSLRDPVLRAHAVRLAVAVVAATAIERALRMPHGYWVALTVLSILQPGQRATNVRIIQRAAGTLVGVALIIVITLVTHDDVVLIACTAAVAFGLFALDERGYFWLVVMLTPTALLLLNVAKFQGPHVGVQRTLNSALGILLGMAIAEVSFRVDEFWRASRSQE
jgi:hypothetical protein